MRFARNKFIAVLVLVTALSLLTNAFAFSPVGVQNRPDDQQSQSKPKLTKPQQSNPPEQDPQEKDDPQGTIKIGQTLVVLDVSAIDQSNKPVMDLTQDNFQVFEDKVPQRIDFFSKEQVPVSVVFAIDTSGSMRAKLDTVIKASVNLVKESRSGDEMSVIEFKDQPELLQEFTADVADVIDTLQGLIASRQTAMLDALYLAADYASKEGKNRRKAVILVTDGLDKDSYYKFSEVVDHMRETDVQVYLIGFISDLEGDGGLFKKSPKDKAQGLLNKLAEETGGKAFFPRELSETHQIAQQISTDLRTQYAIGYYPSNTKKDGTFRAVKVQVNAGQRRVVARTRNGYNAPREGEQRTSVNK